MRKTLKFFEAVADRRKAEGGTLEHLSGLYLEVDIQLRILVLNYECRWGYIGNSIKGFINSRHQQFYVRQWLEGDIVDITHPSYNPNWLKGEFIDMLQTLRY